MSHGSYVTTSFIYLSIKSKNTVSICRLPFVVNCMHADVPITSINYSALLCRNTICNNFSNIFITGCHYYNSYVTGFNFCISICRNARSTYKI